MLLFQQASKSWVSKYFWTKTSPLKPSTLALLAGLWEVVVLEHQGTHTGEPVD